MTRYITVTLTAKEADAVIDACMNSTMDIGDNPGDAYMKAACRAEVKVRKARGEDVSHWAGNWPYSGRYDGQRNGKWNPYG